MNQVFSINVEKLQKYIKKFEENEKLQIIENKTLTKVKYKLPVIKKPESKYQSILSQEFNPLQQNQELGEDSLLKESIFS